jgi:acyl-CoA thioesterase I
LAVAWRRPVVIASVAAVGLLVLWPASATPAVPRAGVTYPVALFTWPPAAAGFTWPPAAAGFTWPPAAALLTWPPAAAGFTWPPAAAGRSGPGPAPGSRALGEHACEQEIEPASGTGVPRLAIVGASFTAGVGSGPGRSWAVLLARHLRWDAVVDGVPGAGYVRAGAGRPGSRGPVAAEIARAVLRALQPSLVIVQAGHDDIGVPPALERRRVEQAVGVIRAEAPRAKIVLLTVFPGRSHRGASRTDRAIVAGARAADPAVIIIRDGLHPTAAGSAWIAGRVAAVLRQYGVRPAPVSAGPGAIICDPAAA